ncbi:hypothetical protein BBP40_002305 [Aspergillus hancockii]|nr:hypothetical protein BBP40_002305 [Aspergillus hancockii]
MASGKSATKTAKPRYQDKYPPSRGSESESSFDYESELESERETQTQQQFAERPQTKEQQRRQPADDPDAKALQPFKKATSPARTTSGPISYRRGSRGEIRRTEGKANMEVQREEKEDTGLKLRLDLNLDIEVELKASIHGDLTLALLWVSEFSVL